MAEKQIVCFQSKKWKYIGRHLKRSVDTLFVGPSEITFGSTKCGQLLDVITHYVIWANQKTIFVVGNAHVQG